MKLPCWQFITQEHDHQKLLEQIHNLYQWGCPWIQLRLKNTPHTEVRPIALEASKWSRKYHKILTINDYPEVALEVNAQGVHLGKTDLPITEARKILGENKLIGGTANTLDDVISLSHQGVNYIGLGPFSFTKTKTNLSPIIGLHGYQNIMNKLSIQKITCPIYAIGGITSNEDILNLLQTGIDGVAFSSLLHQAKDPASLIQWLNKSL